MQDLLATPTVRVLFFGSLLAATLLTPLLVRLAKRYGVVDSGGYRKVHVQPIPLLGGLALLVPFLATCLVAVLGATGVLKLLRPMRGDLVVLAMGGVLIAVLGLMDDAYGLRARYKLLGQVLVAGFVSVLRPPIGLTLPFVGPVGLSPTTSLVLSIVWIVALVNAFNLVDGVDGLAAGVGFIITAGMLAIAADYAHGGMGNQVLVVVTTASLAGSLLGFLFFNFHPARIFLGDTGSMLIGYILASVTLMASYKSNAAAMTLAPFFVFGFPLFETLVSMLRRFVQGKQIFCADQHHTHHRLLRKGYTQRHTTLLLYVVTFLCVAATYVQHRYPWGGHYGWVGASVYGMTLCWIGWYAGYFRLGHLKRILFRRRQNQVFNAFARYASLTLQRSGTIKLDAILDLARKELGLRFLQVWIEDGALLLASASGTPHAAAKSFDTLDQVERLRVKTAEGDVLLIRFEIARAGDVHELHDITACLAGIFDGFHVPQSAEPHIVAIHTTAKTG